MPTTHRIATLAAALTCAALLAGCVGEAPEPEPSPDPTASPVFASEEEALAAATEAYEEYQAMSDLILSEGGAAPERIDVLASGDARNAAHTAFSSFESDGYRLEGRSVVTNAILERLDTTAQGTGEVAIYICLDVTGVDVIDQSGTSVVSADRPPVQAFQTLFTLAQGADLVLTSRDAWSGDGVCE